jgi:hypothetical protein
MLKGAWVLLVECDYVFMKPTPVSSSRAALLFASPTSAAVQPAATYEQGHCLGILESQVHTVP